MADQLSRTPPNAATQSTDLVVATGKTITGTAQTVAALHGNIPADQVVLGFMIAAKDDQGNGGDRGAFLWGDETSQAVYVDAGAALDGRMCPVSDPTKVSLKKPVGADDVANVVVVVFTDNESKLTEDGS